MEKMMMRIPLGFHFAPTDEELISCYLLRRAMALPLMPSGREHSHILETDLYGDKADPWLVFQHVPDSRWDDISDDQDKRVIYVVTKLTKISKGKTRIARRAGCGTWSGQTPPKKIYDESTGQWVGTMRMLSFERPKGEEQYHHDPRDQHHWIMHEYSLDGIHNNNNSKQVDKEYVICRITRVFKGNNKSRNIIDHINQVEDVVVQPSDPNKKRKREVSNNSMQAEADDEGRRRHCSPCFHDHPAVIISREEKEVVFVPPVMNADQLQVESTSAHDDSDPDFDDWMTSLDNVLLDLPEEEDDTQASASNLDLQVESVQADDELYEASTTIAAADWMSLLDDVQLPDDEDEDQHSNYNNWTTTAFNLDHLDLFDELCY